MLFKNLKTGNVVSVDNKDGVELMLRSPIYEIVELKADAQSETVKKSETIKKTKTRAEKTGA